MARTPADVFGGVVIEDVLLESHSSAFDVAWVWNEDTPPVVVDSFGTSGEMRLETPRALRQVDRGIGECEAGLYYRAEVTIDLENFGWSADVGILHRATEPFVPVVQFAKGYLRAPTPVEAVLEAEQSQSIDVDSYAIVDRFGLLTLDRATSAQVLEYWFEIEVGVDGGVSDGLLKGAQGEITWRE